jgi:hypothetical protein
MPAGRDAAQGREFRFMGMIKREKLRMQGKTFQGIGFGMIFGIPRHGVSQPA